MRPEVFRNINVAFITQGCKHCRIICEFIGRINLKLKPEDNIKIVDCTYFQKYNLDESLIRLFNKSFDGFPAVFIKGKRILGSNSRIESEAQLISLLEDNFVLIEDNPNKFIGNCEFEKRGLFKNKVICR